MRKYFVWSAGLCLLFTGLGLTGAITAAAQDQAASTTPPPKVLEIIVETLKPGQSGSPHMKTEAAFPQAFRDAKWPQHYLGMDALSGRQRAIFFVGYNSFDAWQKDTDATMKNATLAAALDSASIADGALLESLETSVYTYREDLSLRGPVDIPHMRYMEITIFNVRSGHEKDFEDLGKMYISAFQKVPNSHWATFEKMYGAQTSGSRFIVVTPLKSLAEVDQEMLDGAAMNKSMSADELKKLRDLSAAAIESTESNLVSFNAKMSYVPDSWTQADPFWNQK
ncbi:MAG TPA: hypothetical protein VL986_06090 [Terracidiphilus sp.]|nr:hypothetical protein [Terracidiphilus sp.]